MVIRTKKDVQQLLGVFETIMSYDVAGKKHYVVFDDVKRKGVWTLMRYADGVFTLHGKGETYMDIGEKVMGAEELQTFIWANRKALNETLRNELQKA